MHRIEECACLAYSNPRNVNLKVNPGLNNPLTKPVFAKTSDKRAVGTETLLSKVNE
jgi:hypothetical protein